MMHDPSDGGDSHTTALESGPNDDDARLQARLATLEKALHESHLREQHDRQQLASAERQASELALLERVRNAMARELELPALFRAVVEAIAATFGYTQVSLYRLDGDTLLLQYQIGYDQVLARIPSGTGVSGRVARSGVPVLLEDVRGEADFLGAISGIVSEVCVPFFDQQRVAGIINIESTLGLPLANSDLQMMVALAENISIAVGRARLYEHARQAQRVQAALFHIAQATNRTSRLGELLKIIHQELGTLIDTTNFYVALYDAGAETYTFPYVVDQFEPGGEFTPQQMRRSLTDYVRRTGAPLLIDPDTRERLKTSGQVESVGRPSLAWLGAPLKTAQGVIGVVVVQSYSERWLYSNKDIELLGFVADHIALAIERKRAETALLESEERFRILADNIPGVIYLCQNDSRYTMLYLNDAVETVTGYTRDEFMHDSVSFMELYHPDDRAWIPVEVDRALARGEPFHLIYRMRHRDGTLRWIEEWGAGVFDKQDGSLRWIEGFLSDISARQKAEEALRQAQKTESLGMLAGGVAHDFNNLLVAMLGQTSLALLQLPTHSPARDCIEKAVTAAERAADLTRQLLAYSGRGQFNNRPVDLNELIAENLHLFAVAVPNHVTLQDRLCQAPALVEGDPGQMQQVVMNLILNAVEAIGERAGRVTVRTSFETVDTRDEHLWQYTGQPLQAGRYVCLEVEDDGSGMDLATLSRIFDPFFTTKFTGRGLGLAAVLGIVRGHKGGLAVASRVGEGTRFKLFFPASMAARVEPAALVRHAVPATSDRLVLVIDDEAPVREAVGDILALEGLRTIAAANGADGVTQYRQHAAEVSLVLLDLSMPGLSGEQTFAALRAINPHVAVILSSGYSQDEASRRFTAQGLAGFLQKPYDAATLLARVRRHWDPAGSGGAGGAGDASGSGR